MGCRISSLMARNTATASPAAAMPSSLTTMRGDSVLMLADGNGDYARALGLEMDGTGFGMGMRGQRFAIVVEDGTATHVAVEAPGQFEVSKVEAILQAF